MSFPGRRPGRPGAALTLLTLSLALLVTAGPAAARQEAAVAEEEAPLDLERVVEMLRAGSSSSDITALVAARGGSFHLTVDDVVKLRKMGATPGLILAMADGGATGPEPPPEALPAPSGSLTVRQVTRALGKGQPPVEVIAWIHAQGMKETPELRQILDLMDRGVPAEVLKAMAQAPAEAAATPPAPHPLDAAAIIQLLDEAESTAEVAATVRQRGVAAPPTLDEALALRDAGADDLVMTAIREAVAAPAAAPPEPAVLEVVPGVIAVPQESLPERSRFAGPTPATEDRLWVASVPSGARVYLASARVRLEEVLEHEHYLGRTPLAVSLEPGDYYVVVQKEAEAFEQGLAPAWRTAHDLATTRSLLDDADLTFDPLACCLPGSLGGQARLLPVPQDIPRTLIGDAFEGLPPWLFDGEKLQVLRVRDTAITESMKIYRVRKHTGRSRTLVSLFLPAEGDPLDQNTVRGLPAGTPYDAYVDAPSLEALREPSQLSDLASALGLEPSHLGEAVAMLRRAGKAIVHQQAPHGVRLVTLAVEDEGRLRVVDRTIQPAAPFDPPPPPPPKKKKKPEPPPPVPPPLPGMHRIVVPGQGLPRLAIQNSSSAGLGILLDDGLLLWVPAGARREFPVDPGTYDARVLSPAASAASPAPQGRLHFSYNARYAMTF